MESVLFKQEENVGIITLNRPEVYNSFNIPMGVRMADILDQCEADDEIRAIYITGNGKGFCAGEDLQEVTGDNIPGFDEILDKTFNAILSRIRRIEKPIVCGVNGVAAGAGANIALACDITFALESVKFIQAFTSIGLVPDSGGTKTLPQLVGMQRAAALMFTGDKVSAVDAERIGMIYKCAESLDEAMAMAKKLSTRPTKAIGLTKRLLNSASTNSFEQQLAMEKDLQIEAANSHDYNEGVAAFLEKRKPEFKGK
ncbi:MAG: 2-(1,2-epoxy-1,2-dihydrophenyl)acetyl-CoA isomerase [Patiriisocius sp.]|jgi:2-(1,2-epoxy-1,2-dihydrophenyl)acetyl-CoA isomerase